ncbi:MAG: hypothetical protein AAF633_00350 [Chloroflexota bacterium]
MTKQLNPNQNQNKVQPPKSVLGEKEDGLSSGADMAARFAGGMEAMQQSLGNQALSQMVQRAMGQETPAAETEETLEEAQVENELDASPAATADVETGTDPATPEANSGESSGGVLQRSADSNAGKESASKDVELEQGEEFEDQAELAFDSILGRASGGEAPSENGSGDDKPTIQRTLSVGDVSPNTLQAKRRSRGGSKRKASASKKKGSKKGSAKKQKTDKDGDDGGGGGFADMLQGGAAEMLAGGGLEALMAGGNPMDMMMQMMGGGDPMQMMMQMMGGGGDMSQMMPMMMMMMQNK